MSENAIICIFVLAQLLACIYFIENEGRTIKCRCGAKINLSEIRCGKCGKTGLRFMHSPTVKRKTCVCLNCKRDHPVLCPVCKTWNGG